MSAATRQPMSIAIETDQSPFQSYRAFNLRRPLISKGDDDSEGERGDSYTIFFSPPLCIVRAQFHTCFSDVHLTCALVVTLTTYSRWLEIACKTAHAQNLPTLKQNHKDVLLPAHLQKTVPIGERQWTGIELEDYSPVVFPVSKQLSTLLRHGHLPREDDGAIELWRLKEYL